LGAKEHDLAASRNSGLELRAIGSAEGEANLGGSRCGSHRRTHHPKAAGQKLAPKGSEREESKKAPVEPHLIACPARKHSPARRRLGLITECHRVDSRKEPARAAIG